MLAVYIGNAGSVGSLVLTMSQSRIKIIMYA